MLQITIQKTDLYDDEKEEFVYVPQTTIELEHSLDAISKWEMLWKKPFLTDDGLSVEQTLDYIKCMTITPNVDPVVYLCLNDSNVNKIKNYINSSMTATWFSKSKTGKNVSSTEAITSELIYYWMICCDIPFECDKWNISRLLTLIEICNVKNSEKKVSQKEQMMRNADINAQRKKKYNTKG